MVTIEEIKKLREETGVSLMEVKKALEEAGGDTVKAKEILKSWGQKVAGKKTEREARSGVIDYYLHPNLKTGVLLDIRCESDFVAQSPDFKNLAHEICLQIAGVKPIYVSENDIPQEVIEKETEMYKKEVAESGKPENIVSQIIEGKLGKYKATVCLVNQVWIKDDTKTIKNLIEEAVSKLGEKIEVKRFVCYEL